MALLDDFRSAKGAEFRHGKHTGCLRGTHGPVLDGIELWAGDFCQHSIYWLNGLTGTGKSTIAKTIAERLFADGRLGASFCSGTLRTGGTLRSYSQPWPPNLHTHTPNFGHSSSHQCSQTQTLPMNHYMVRWRSSQVVLTSPIVPSPLGDHCPRIP